MDVSSGQDKMVEIADFNKSLRQRHLPTPPTPHHPNLPI